MDKKHLLPLFNLLSIAYLLSHHAYICNASKARIGSKGKWELLLNNTGVVAMHMALTHRNTVIMFDRTGSSQTGYPLRRRYNGTRCKGTINDLEDSSCYAHSIEYDIARNKIRPLDMKTDAWGSSGSMLSNGTLAQMGGFGDGSRRTRYFEPCGDINCEWRLGKELLSSERWCASNLKLPENEDRLIIIGGRRSFSYEFVPRRSSQEKPFDLPFLERTYDRNEGENNLYPIVHLSSDGHLFIFANRDSILFDYKLHIVVKTFPKIPGKGSRTYPSSGSSVILPLDHKNGFKRVDVMICGGAAYGAFSAAKRGRFLWGSRTCGKMVITGSKHKWRMEKMPGRRLMHDMIILPTGDILIINGVKKGCAGLNYATGPALKPYLYKPKKTLGRRFSVLKPTKIARMYHSSAVLLPNGRVLVGGSNPNDKYTFKNVAHPTELRLQAFVPRYMSNELDDKRAHNVTIYSGRNDELVGYGEDFGVDFMLDKMGRESEVVFSVYATPFNTHSMSMNQRMVILKCKKMVKSKDGWVRALVEAPPSPRVAPSGYYMLSVVNDGVPSISQWVRFM